MLKKCILSLLMVAALLLCMQPVSANAEDATIAPGDTITYALTEDTTLTYTFTAPKSATYVFWAEDQSDCGISIIVNEYEDSIAYGGDRAQFAAKAGTTYSIEVDLYYYGYTEPCDLVFHLAEGTVVESITLDYSSYVGFVGETLYLTGTSLPGNGIEGGTWSTSDPDVVEIKWEGIIWANLLLKAEGTAIVTYTNENGVTASCTVTVKEPMPLTEGTSSTVSIAPGEYVGFAFTAPEDAYYYFLREEPAGADYYFDCEFSLGGWGYGLEGELGGYITDGNEIFYGCYAGNSYVVTMSNTGTETYEFTVSIHKAVPATSLTLVGDEETYIGDGYWVDAVLSPQFAIKEKITWTISDTSIVEVMGSGSTWRFLQPLAEGTVTITATSESGLTDSITVNIVELSYDLSGDPLTLGKPNKVTIQDSEDFTVYEFVPAQSGYYQFDHDADQYAVIGIVKNNEEDIAGYYFKNDVDGFVAWLDAGETYYIYSYYLDETVTGTYNIYVTKLPTAENGWVQCRNGWYYYQDGDLAFGWVKDGGKWYYVRNMGSMVTGWREIDGSWYYLDSYMKTGWQKIDGSWYYLGTNGAMCTGWQSIGGKWYYLSDSGVMQTGWVQVDGKWYYMNTSGVMQTGWQSIGGKWYYLDSYMKTGWQSIGGKWYYMNTSGVMQTGWQKIDGSWYYLNSYMMTGWQKIDGNWYYLKNEMKTGWQSIGGSWYYLGSNGVMRTGWQKLSGSWYYLGTNGVMVTGTQVIDGKTYVFSSSGVWLG